MTIREQEEMLFAEWKEKRPGFVDDGVIDESEYLKSCPKIVFILKEVNGGWAWNLKGYVREGGKAQTWNNIARWIYGIRRLYQNKRLEDDVWSKVDWVSAEFRKEQLKTICTMNLKKTPGGSATNHKELLTFAKEDLPFIKRQLNIYMPDIIINCSRAPLDPEITEAFTVVEFYHPQARGKRFKKKDMFDALMAAVKETIGQ